MLPSLINSTSLVDCAITWAMFIFKYNGWKKIAIVLVGLRDYQTRKETQTYCQDNSSARRCDWESKIKQRWKKQVDFWNGLENCKSQFSDHSRVQRQEDYNGIDLESIKEALTDRFEEKEWKVLVWIRIVVGSVKWSACQAETRADLLN